MAKSNYKGCKERIVEICGNNKSLFLHSVDNVCDYDIGRIFEARDDKVAEFVDFLFAKERYPLPLITSKEKQAIVTNLNEDRQGGTAKRAAETQKERLEDEVTSLRRLCHRSDELHRETGTQDLCVGYPFVFGAVGRGARQIIVKAPLLLFPVKISIKDSTTAEIIIDESEKIRINPVLISAYAKAKKINVENLCLEFGNMSEFKNLRDVIDYLAKAKIKIDYTHSKNVFGYGKFKEPSAKSELSVRFAAVLGRFPLSNAIYDDYAELEKKRLTNDAVCELLQDCKKEKQKGIKKASAKRSLDSKRCYAVKPCDYAQYAAIRKASEASGTVIVGPAGTGKTHTVINLITDAVTKGKRVLVVSPRKSTRDTIIDGLGDLGNMTVSINDELRERNHFYERCLATHEKITHSRLPDVRTPENSYLELDDRLATAEERLKDIEELFCRRGEFGLSLYEMYSRSCMLQKGSSEQAIHLALTSNKAILALNYAELTSAISEIHAFDLAKIYYDFAEANKKTPFMSCVLIKKDESTLSAAKLRLTELQKAKKELFDIESHPYYRQVVSDYLTKSDDKSLALAVRKQCELEKVSILRRKQRERELAEAFRNTRKAILDYTAEYEFLLGVLTEAGYTEVIENILRGNGAFTKSVISAIDSCIVYRDSSIAIDGLDEGRRAILSFAYEVCKNYQSYTKIIDALPEIRIYHEIMSCEQTMAKEFSSLSHYEGILSDVAKLREYEPTVAARLCAARSERKYIDFYKVAKNGRDFVYAISKKQKYPPIKDTVADFREFLLTLFPCWILSPENVSTVLPLERNLFDIVIFDDAAQMLTESALPAVLRSRNVVVMGDPMQLRPSAKSESLLDLAMAKYEKVELTRYYRSMHQELIDFSNRAFYSSDLQIAPSVTENRDTPPIVRYKVSGEWQDGRNPAEAKKIVALLKNIFSSRKNNESIGIIALSDEQRICIADAIYEEAESSVAFRTNIMREMRRADGRVDKSLLVKSLSNLQGDTRDIIIISVGYAKNGSGKLCADFTSLSATDSENRLNTAISRATSKVILVTSIESEDLKIDRQAPLGALRLKEYLAYGEAISAGKRNEAEAILAGLGKVEEEPSPTALKYDVAREMRQRLEKLGFTVRSELGNRDCGISLAIYDKETDRYLLGIELDCDTHAASTSIIDRHVCKTLFLESRGWTVLYVRCRDWWLSSAKVIKQITYAAEKSKKKIEKELS